MLTLYHGDTAVCAAKVRVTLAEKQLAFEGILLDLQKGDQFKPEYRKLNANAVVPTLLHDGAVITESTVINEYLDEVFPAPALRPAAAVDRARMRLWTKREDAIHDGINTMTTAIIFRVADLKKAPEALEAKFAAYPNPAKGEKARDLTFKGLESKYVAEALVRFAMLFRDMEAALARGPWLLGADFSLADVGFMSFFYRLELMQTGGMWRDHFPRVTDWFERCKQRPSFATAIADFIGGEKIAQYRAIGLPLAPLVDVEFRKALQMI
jgi:glutathione S-transferase